MYKGSSKKAALYIFLVISIAVTVFSVAAICNFCGAGEEADESGKIDVDRTDEGSDAVDNGDSESDEDETTSTTAGDKEAPTVELKIIKGPEYSSDDDVCYYQVEAIVTGNPMPDKAEFSRDDSNSSWGPFVAQVNLTQSQPDYTLTATVTNSEGTDSDSIDLSWGCNGENRDPEISSITLSEANPVVDEQYAVTAVASDPDGDDLEYQWSISAGGGTIANDATNPMQWTTPNSGGTYTIELTVTDGKGGEDTKTKDVDVGLPAPPPFADVYLNQVIIEGGYVERDGWVNQGGVVYAGDLKPGDPNPAVTGNKGVRGFISFDTSGMSGVTITDAILTFSITQKKGDPSTLGNVNIAKVYWGVRKLQDTDYNLGEETIRTYANTGSGNYTIQTQDLKDLLQDTVDAGDPRFQIRIRLGIASDSDNTADGIEYNQNDINLRVIYEY